MARRSWRGCWGNRAADWLGGLELEIYSWSESHRPFAKLGLSSALGRKLSGTLSLQRTRSRGTQVPYAETSLTAGMLYRF